MTSKIESLLAEVNGATFLGIDTVTVVPLKGGKSNPFQGRVTKQVTGSNVMVFSNKKCSAYESIVKRRLEQEGKDPRSFSLSPRVWGVRRENQPFVDYNEKVYLEVIFLKPGNVEYKLDGKPCTQSDMITLMKNGLNTDKSSSEQGGLDNKVIIRTYSIESIKAITVNHQKHIL